jgi:hypothetical protein
MFQIANDYERRAELAEERLKREHRKAESFTRNDLPCETGLP